MDNTINIEKFNKSLELCEHRANIIKQLSELTQTINNKAPKLSKHDFNRKWLKEHILLKNISIIAMLLLFILSLSMLFVFPAFRNDIQKSIYFILIILILCISPIIIIICIRRSSYNKYINSFSVTPKKLQQINNEILSLQNTLKEVESFMSFPENCIIPKNYWDKYIELMNIIFSNINLTMEQAIQLLNN